MILHVDMDAFYASVEQRDNPELRGKPVVVGGTPEQRGVVAAASYEARQFGVYSAMPSGTALRLCPEAIFIPMRMDYYRKISGQLNEILRRFTPLVEPLALDEAFLDVKDSIRLFGSALRIAESIKRDIQEQLGLTASVGIAPNKFLAKIASDIDKPDGLYQVPQPVQSFLDALPVTRLWGIGKVSAGKLDRLGIRSIADFRCADHQLLERTLGHNIDHLLRLAQGEDDRTVTVDADAKSISRETTFVEDVQDMEVLESTLMRLTEDVAARLRHSGLFAKTVGIKLRFADFKTVTRDQTHAASTNVTRTIWTSARQLLQSAVDGRDLGVRLIGVRLQALESERHREAELFEQTELDRQTQVDSVIDSINSRFGKSTVHRATVKPPQKSRHPDS